MNSHFYLDQFKLRLAETVLATADLQAIRAKSLDNLERWRSQGVWCSAYDEWKHILTHGIDDELIAIMTGDNEYSNRLRQSPPYVGIISQNTRNELLEEMHRLKTSSLASGSSE